VAPVTLADSPLTSSAAPLRDRLAVDELLAALPEGEAFQALRDQLLAHSVQDPLKQWASSSAYATYDKRTLTPEAIRAARDAAAAAAQALQREILEAANVVADRLLAGDRAGAALRLVELGDALEAHGRRAEARTTYEKALEAAGPLGDASPQLVALRRLARLSQGFGELDRAFHLYQVAVNLARDAGDAQEASAAATGLGNVKVDQGKWEAAEGHYTAARLHAEEAGDEFLLGQLWNNLSVVRRRMGDLEGALAFSRRAMTVFEELEHPGELARCHNNLGLVHAERRDFSAAREAYDAALALAESPFVTAATRANLCELHLREGRWLLAEEQARLGEELALRHGFDLVLVHVYRLLGMLARLREDANGVTFFEKALEIARRRHYLHAQAEVHLEYGLFRRALGEDEEAAGHLERALALYRHLGSRSDEGRAAELLAEVAPPGMQRPA
jgi:tetratricopeptide (TPR) repeat protein